MKTYICIKEFMSIRHYKKGVEYNIHEPKEIAGAMWCEVETDIPTYTGGGHIRLSSLTQYFEEV